ncbi:MAG: gamma-glutamyltransferase [Myxococcota bacterium]|nr:gamma-glutamyltransferase [Myxococcota bacterium]
MTGLIDRLSACFVPVLIVMLSPAAWAASPAPASARNGMVVSSQADATRAGVALLQAGGNAVDAAVATAFAVGVTQPFSTGIGGGGFILIRTEAGEVIAIDARETAPAAATSDMYVREGVDERASVRGPLAVGTPGLVAGLAMALDLYGTKTLSECMQPAIALAETGFEVSAYNVRLMEFMRRRLSVERFPETARIQFPKASETTRAGWRLVQKDLAKSLSLIAEEGPSAFYEGPIAQAIAQEMERRGGLVNAVDLASYRPVRRDVVTGSYRGLRIHSFPPPSSGGVLLVQMLNVLEGYDDLAERGAGSSASLHVIAEAMKLAFADRAFFLGDPDFVEMPIETLVSKEYAAQQRARIDPPWFRRAPWDWFRGEMAITVKAPGIPVEDHGTTHLSVTDRFGNAVAITKTINTPYGSGITARGTGILLNNEMDDFAKAIGVPNSYGLIDTRGANLVAPGKRPLSSMTPTIVEKEGKVFLVTGSPGGSRIISATLLSILNVVDYGMNVKQAVAAPRFHHQWDPDKLVVEPAVPLDVIRGLRERGHTVEASPRNWSAVEAILVDPESGLHYGGNDPRRDGLALGF